MTHPESGNLVVVTCDDFQAQIPLSQIVRIVANETSVGVAEELVTVGLGHTYRKCLNKGIGGDTFIRFWTSSRVREKLLGPRQPLNPQYVRKVYIDYVDEECNPGELVAIYDKNKVVFVNERGSAVYTYIRQLVTRLALPPPGKEDEDTVEYLLEWCQQREEEEKEEQQFRANLKHLTQRLDKTAIQEEPTTPPASTRPAPSARNALSPEGQRPSPAPPHTPPSRTPEDKDVPN